MNLTVINNRLLRNNAYIRTKANIINIPCRRDIEQGVTFL